jgi:hypothetical protein
MVGLDGAADHEGAPDWLPFTQGSVWLIAKVSEAL